MQPPEVHVPTYRRADLLPERTLATLARSRVQLAHVWLSDPTERPAYEAAIAAADLPIDVELHDGAAGTAGNRTAAMAGYPAGTRMLFADDDLQAIERLNAADDKLEPAPDLGVVAELGWMGCAQAGARLWGVYPARNAYFMRRQVTTDLRLITGGLYGIELAADGGADWQRTTIPVKEDHQRTIEHYLRDGAVVRLRSHTYHQRYYTASGGMGEWRTDDMIDQAAATLAAMYPQLCTPYRRTNGRAEVRLADRRPR